MEQSEGVLLTDGYWTELYEHRVLTKAEDFDLKHALWEIFPRAWKMAKSCIKHKTEYRDQHCSLCHIELFTKHFIPYQAGIRFPQKPGELEHYLNMMSGKCWCGKPKKEWDKFQRKYCTHAHNQIWNNEINPTWQAFRNEFLHEHGIKYDCKEWGDCKYYWNCTNCHARIDEEPELDHIQAIALGGWCYDKSNIRILCKACHIEKTKSDVTLIAWWKRDTNYDIGIIEIESQNQLILESFISLD